MPINIHGKEYVTVSERIQMLHQSDFTEISLNTEILHDDETSIVMKATIDLDGNSYTGIAQEIKGSTNINKTSAVGRCLGFAGFGAVESIASADEVANAVSQQKPEFATPNQVKYIKSLCQEKNIEVPDEKFDNMTKTDAARTIEKLIKGDNK